MSKNLILILSMVAFVGCGSSSSESKIDIAEYLSRTNMNKDFTHVKKIDGHTINSTYENKLVVEQNLITIEKDSTPNQIITIKPDEIEIKYLSDSNSSKTLKRNINKGDIVSNYTKEYKKEILKIGTQEVGERDTNITEVCILDSFIDNYEKFFFQYTNYDDKHNIMKLKCLTKTIIDTKVDEKYIDRVSYANGVVESKDDISYLFLQKDLGMIATINDDCLISKSPDIIDDTLLGGDKCLEERYEYDLYQPQY